MTKAATFQDPMFHDEDKAREALEAELWPDGPICRHCGNADPDKIAKMQGKSHRPGLYYCHECNGQFTVTVGTVLERSKSAFDQVAHGRSHVQFGQERRIALTKSTAR